MNKEELLSLLQTNTKFLNITEPNNQTLKIRGFDYCFEFLTIINALETRMLIGFKKRFPTVCPEYFLLPNDALGHIPHVERDGRVCYTNSEYLFVDYTNPQGIINESFDKVIETLTNGVLKQNQDDFLNEFESYWQRLPSPQIIYSNLSYSDEVQKIRIGRSKDVTFAIDDSEKASTPISRVINTTKITYENGIHIPLKRGSRYFPPSYDFLFTLKDIRDLINLMMDSKNKTSFQNLVSKAPKQIEHVIFSQIQQNGVHSLFGFKISKIHSSTHPLIDINQTCKIETVSMMRLDKFYMLNRGGNGEQFDSLKGLIIGCGAVGGYIVEELVKAGFLNLTLIDNDKLSIDNCYRHVCGIAYNNENKAEALKKKTELYYPHAEIEAISKPFEEVLFEKKLDLSQYNFVIAATGNVTTNMILNEKLFANHPNLPLLITWLEPYGIGGHCLVTNLNESGCYHCLYNNSEFYNQASFAHIEQSKPFQKTVSGCGSMYTPFGSMDANQTALLTVRMLIKTFKHSKDASGIYSWKGDSELFQGAGYSLSERYLQTEQVLLENKRKFISPNCKVCKDVSARV
jgi:molybdopterin/thiamine biosynthesis adenylyltransferase